MILSIVRNIFILCKNKICNEKCIRIYEISLKKIEYDECFIYGMKVEETKSIQVHTQQIWQNDYQHVGRLLLRRLIRSCSICLLFIRQIELDSLPSP